MKKKISEFEKIILDRKKKAVDELEERRAENDRLVRKTLETRPLSYSSIKNFIKSPQHYIEYITAERKPDTDATRLGKLFDIMLLTPEKFEKIYRIFNKAVGTGSRATNSEAKEKAEEDGVVLIDQELYDKALDMVSSVLNDKDAMYYIDRFKFTQGRLEWTDPETKLRCIGYTDGESDVEDTDYFICDIKTTSDGEENKFIRDAHNFGYHLQEGAYTHCAKVRYFKFPDFIHITIDSKSPYAVNVFRATAEYTEQSQKEWTAALVAFNYCLKENLWHLGYSFHRLGVPYFQMRLPAYNRPKFQ